MRYLKEYKLFESYQKKREDILAICRDILSDLSDEGYQTKVDFCLDSSILVIVYKGLDEKFEFENIENTINRLSSYLETEKFDHPVIGKVGTYPIINEDSYTLKGVGYRCEVRWETPQSHSCHNI